MNNLEIVKKKINETNVLFFVLLILVGFTIFKRFFGNFGILIFVLISALLIIFFWNYRKSQAILKLMEKVKELPYLSVFFTIAAYCLIVLPFEYLMTEVWYKIAYFPQYLTVSFLIVFGFIFSLINWKKFLNKRLNTVIVCLILLISTFAYLKYNKEKLKREYLPKIYNISPSWGVQAQIIKLEGVNFGPVWKGGKVYIGEVEAIIKDWGNNTIIVEQPVTAPFGHFGMKIVCEDNIESNISKPYEVRNPNRI